MTGAEFRAAALALPGTTEKPHFERPAFKVRRNFATLLGGSANLLLTPDEQAHFTGLSTAVRPVPNKWGERGWTTVDLVSVDAGLLEVMMRTAWRNGGGTE